MRRRRALMVPAAAAWFPPNGRWSLALLLLLAVQGLGGARLVAADGCPPSEAILPCRCSLRGKEIQIWCSHSNLPQIMDGIKAVERNIKSPIDELVLENNQLPALPGRFFGSLQIVRLMLRYNSIERVSNGWLNELENSLVEIYIVEPQLRSIPVESLNGMINMIAITIQSDELKHLPDFSGLLSLTYLSVQSRSLSELQPHWFRHLPKVQNIHITGGPHLNRLEAGLFDGLISLKNIDLSRNGINWIHLRALARLPNLVSLKLSHNEISDVGMIGRIVKDLENLKKLRLDHNIINIVEDGSFVDLPYLSELHLNDNRITEVQYGAFLRTPMLKTIYMHNNHIKRIHPESFLQASGSGVETVYVYNNEIDDVHALRSLLDALPALKFLDLSNNHLTELPFGALRGHGTLEQLHLNNNQLRSIERDALMAMPALRELRLRNNSLSSALPMPFWNLPGLKGLDLSLNQFREVDSHLLAGLPSLRRLDLSENGLTKLDPTTFIHNPMLETLNISANELVIVHPATFRQLDRLFEVDASYNQLLEMLPGLPKIVERVSVHGNLISALPVAASQALALPNLRMLDLSLNRLEHLPKYGFQGAGQLRVLSLANNRLRSLDDTSLIGAHRLELLHLQDNALARIDERAFLALPELRNLNLQGNKLEAITDNMFSNNTRLEQLDLSRNLVRTIAPAAFEAQRSLEYLDLSGNALSDISIGLSNLANVRDVDLSYNQITRVHADVVSAWRNVVEIRLANNLIVELKHGTFRNLPKLQYLDLSSNEINSVESGSLKHLEELQEFVLADNKIVELRDHVFENLPNLLAAHFQYNAMRYISPESFYNAPSMVFLNLSNNDFHNMENIGLRSMRNLEVLDLSSNGVRTVSTMPLKALNWLVELKIDNNQICKIQGSPFETMPRLRVLSMRNNRLRTIRERTFRNLRGNIAILDVDGNPIDCSCDMQWLSVWLQETNFPYPGPRCQDGRLLRAARIEKSLCASAGYDDTNQRTGHRGSSAGVSSSGPDGSNSLPLINEHGDVFQRQLGRAADELGAGDECEAYDAAGGHERPLVGESEYFYDQYVDYPPANETGSYSTDAPTSSPQQVASSTLSHDQQRPPQPVSPNIDLNNTILHTNYFHKRPGASATPQSSSPFTFFGYPIPSLSVGRFFGVGQRGRKDRGEHSATTATSTTRQATSTLPSTERHPAGTGATGRGKVRMYQPNSAEFEKYLNQGDHDETTQYHDVTSRNNYVETNSDEAASHEAGGVFRTSFREPSSVERGGFRPIVPAHVGGFMPVHDPHSRRGHVEAVTTSTRRPNNEPVSPKRVETSERHLVPVATETAPPKRHLPQKVSHYGTPSPQSEEVEAQTYYVTEMPIEATTPVVRRITPPHYTQTHSRATTTSTTPMPSTVPTTTLRTTTTLKTTTTTRRYSPSLPPSSTTSTIVDHLDSEFYNDDDDAEDDDLEGQAFGLLKPPPLPVQSTTAETILLIPPPEEHAEQLKRHSWLLSTTTTTTESIPTQPPGILATTTSSSTQRIPKPVAGSRSGSGGRSHIVKVFTPATLHHYLPTAEEYYRTTPSAVSDSQLTIDAQKREFYIGDDDVDRYHNKQETVQAEKNGMDWYYESFKKRTGSIYDGSQSNTNKRLPSGSSMRSSEYPKHSSGAERRVSRCFWYLIGGISWIMLL